jgi:hypothetical protein
MEIIRIQPNCSECALVVYPDKINSKQMDFLNKWFIDKGLTTSFTPLNNIVIETGVDSNPNYKDGLWALRESIEELSTYLNLGLKEEEHYALIRDDSYYDMVEEGRI